MSRRKTADYGGNPFFRTLVLTALAGADGWMSAREISEITGLGYKQTIDALSYLYNDGKVARTGRKFTARWGRLELEVKQNNSEQQAILIRCLLRGYMEP